MFEIHPKRSGTRQNRRTKASGMATDQTIDCQRAATHRRVLIQGEVTCIPSSWTLRRARHPPTKAHRARIPRVLRRKYPDLRSVGVSMAWKGYET